MDMSRSQHHTRYDRALRRAAILVSLFVALVSPAVWADPLNEKASGVAPPELETFGTDTPLGRLSYQAGRGVRVGETGLVLGGFVTTEVERQEEGDSRGGLDSVNLLVFLDPVPFAHLFTELEWGPLAQLERGQEGVHSNTNVTVKRLYLDFGTSDVVNVRFGKFLTPIGRWNVAPREPLLWTTSDPLIVEKVFDNTATGAMLFGSVFPRGGALSYSLYGSFLDQPDVDRDEVSATDSVGAHLEWASLAGWTVGASYFASEGRDREWNHLGAADFLWQLHERVEVSSEVLFGEGSRKNGGLWGLYLQGVVETVRTLYLVGRYEHFDPPGTGRAVNLFDVGFAWVPVPYLRLKADYLFADHRRELSEPGFRLSLSLLF